MCPDWISLKILFKWVWGYDNELPEIENAAFGSYHRQQLFARAALTFFAAPPSTPINQ